MCKPLYITKILAFIGIENSNMQYFEFADYVEKHLSLQREIQTLLNMSSRQALANIPALKEVDLLCVKKLCMMFIINNLYLKISKYRLNLL